MRKTKIICTIGPASATEEVLTEMCHAGMNVARLNFSHGTHPEHKEKIELVKRVREKLNLPIAIMLDTKGPEYRIGTFKNGKVEVEDGSTILQAAKKLGIFIPTFCFDDFERMPAKHCSNCHGQAMCENSKTQ